MKDLCQLWELSNTTAWLGSTLSSFSYWRLLGYLVSCCLQLVQTMMVCFFCMFMLEIVKLSRRKIKSWGQILEELLGCVCLCISQLDRDYVVLCSAAGRHGQRCFIERVYMTLLKNILLMCMEKSLLGTSGGREKRRLMNYGDWEKIFWWMEIHQLRELYIKEDSTMLENKNILPSSFVGVEGTCSFNN